jgi:hypothetical protein
VCAKRFVQHFSGFSLSTRAVRHGLFDADDLMALRAFAEAMTGAIHFFLWSKPSHVGQFWLFHASSFPRARRFGYTVDIHTDPLPKSALIAFSLPIGLGGFPTLSGDFLILPLMAHDSCSPHKFPGMAHVHIPGLFASVASGHQTDWPVSFGDAKFIHLWQNEDGVWKITRVVSFDSHPAQLHSVVTELLFTHFPLHTPRNLVIVVISCRLYSRYV